MITELYLSTKCPEGPTPLYFFKLEFTPCKAEQPPQGMESQEKELQKD